MKFLAFDIEISNVFNLRAGEDIEKYAPFDVAVAATQIAGGEHRLWFSPPRRRLPEANTVSGSRPVPRTGPCPIWSANTPENCSSISRKCSARATPSAPGTASVSTSSGSPAPPAI